MRVEKYLMVISLLSVLYPRPARGDDDDSDYVVTPLVSDQNIPGIKTVDPLLTNAWGLASSPTGPWWVANNGSDTSTVYNGDGTKLSLTVTVPPTPTGLVFNGGPNFEIQSDLDTGVARFLFATEGGVIAGWSPSVPPSSTQAIVAVDNSAKGAIYKGLAILDDHLYATDFHNGRVDVFDGSFAPVVKPGAFTDDHLPAGYAPFGIRAIDDIIYVTYALQDADAEDDVSGHGHGFVDAYDKDGAFLQRVASRDHLNSPWGLALAPCNFGRFSNMLLIGNFGDGHIHAFEQYKKGGKGHFRGALRDEDGKVTIDGLWSISFGNGGAAGHTNELFFAAGPNDEQNGLFGMITPSCH